jgi:hypothetical protein
MFLFAFGVELLSFTQIVSSLTALPEGSQVVINTGQSHFGLGPAVPRVDDLAGFSASCFNIAKSITRHVKEHASVCCVSCTHAQQLSRPLTKA